MPEFIRPRRVIVETGGGGGAGLLLLAGAVVAAAAVVLFIVAHLWLIAGAAVVLAGIGAGLVWYLRRFTLVYVQRRADPRRVVQQPVLTLRPAGVVIPAELDAPAARAVAGGGDHLAIDPPAVSVENVNRPRWPDRPAGALDRAGWAGVLKRRPGHGDRMPR